jgi:Mg2+/Co2+ transporter CorB
MKFEDWMTLTAIFLCLLLSFFFAGSETALTASSRAAMLRLEQDGNRKAGIVNKLLAARERMIGALLLGNNAVNIVASSLATALFLTWWGEIGVFYATVVMTVMVVVFAEVLPKTAAIMRPDRFALSVARPISWVVRLLLPILAAIEAVVRVILRPFGIRAGESHAILSPHEELRGTVDLLHREGGVETLDRDMVGGVLDLRELEVRDVMVHRTEMMMLNADDPPEEIVRAMLASEYTRVPLWRGSPENIVGILHAKDLLRAIRSTTEDDFSKLDVTAIALPPWFVPDIRPLSEQLKAFRRRKTHFALVVDEYGDLMGMVTLEDVLEQIVGDISDEQDIPVPGVRLQPDGSVNVDGAVPVRDLNRAMNWKLPDEEATTVAGLVIHEARSIPEVGQSFTFHGFRFRVQRKHRNRITALRITPLVSRPAVARAG